MSKRAIALPKASSFDDRLCQCAKRLQG